MLKQDTENSVVCATNESILFAIEIEASDFAIAATLKQDWKPVTFFPWGLVRTEVNHSSVEKEAYPTVESFHNWKQCVPGKYFTLITNHKIFELTTYTFNYYQKPVRLFV